MFPCLIALLKGVDWWIDRTGRVVSWLIVFIMLNMVFEVIARYVFNNPTVWAYDTTYMMSGVLYLFTASYVLLHRGDVRVDLFYARYSARTRRIVDLVLMPILFFTAVGIFTQQAWMFAFRALAMRETVMGGIWEPSMVPFRFVIAIGFSLIAVGGISWFTRDLLFLITGKETGGEIHD